MAETDVGPQAFVMGRSLGLQFHPEVTTDIMTDWVREYRHELDADGVDPTPCSRRRSDVPWTASGCRCGSWSGSSAMSRDSTRAVRGRPSAEDERRWRGRSGRRTREVFPRFLDLPYPNVERGDGVWLTTTDGRRILDACSGGAMVACLGHGVPGGRRGGGRAGAGHLVLLQPPFHERAAGAARRPPAGDRGSGDGADPVRVGWLRGQRDGATARAALPRGARRCGPLAGDLARAGLPRFHDGNARPERPSHAAGAVHPVPRAPPAPRAIDVAVRPDRRGRAATTRRTPRRGRAGDDRGVLLRARERSGAARLLAAGSVLARAGRAAHGARLLDLLRRSGHRDGTHRDVARRPSAADRARHR